jgi:hypothetical protein
VDKASTMDLSHADSQVTNNGDARMEVGLAAVSPNDWGKRTKTSLARELIG